MNDGFRRHAKQRGDDCPWVAEGDKAPNGANLFLSKFCRTGLLTVIRDGEAVNVSMAHVLPPCAPLKVFGSIVRLYSVFMINFISFWIWIFRKKRLNHHPSNGHVSITSVTANVSSDVSVLINPKLYNPVASDRACVSAYPSKVGHRVLWKIWYCFPHLHRAIDFIRHLRPFSSRLTVFRCGIRRQPFLAPTFLSVLFSASSIFEAQAAVPSYNSFRGTGGISIVSNPPTGTIVIDGSGVFTSSGTNATISTSTNGTLVAAASTNLNFVPGNNLYAYLTNLASKTHIGIGVNSNLLFYGNRFLLGSDNASGFFGVSNATTGRWSLYSGDPSQDDWFLSGKFWASNLVLSTLVGSGAIVAVNPTGEIYRTNGATVLAGQSVTVTTNSGNAYTVAVGLKDLQMSGTNRITFTNGIVLYQSPTNDALYLFNTNNTAPMLIFSDGVAGAGFQSGGGASIDAVSTYSNIQVLATVRMRRLVMTNGAVAGYVLTADDSTGLASWQPNTGGGGGGGTNSPGGQTRSIQVNSNGTFSGDTYLQYFSDFNIGGDPFPAITLGVGGITNIMSYSGFGTATPDYLSLLTSNSIRWTITKDGDILPGVPTGIGTSGGSNRYDIGSWALPVRTNWVNDLVAVENVVSQGSFVGNGSGITNLGVAALPYGVSTNLPPKSGLLAWYSPSGLTGTNGQWMTNVLDLSGNNYTATSSLPPRMQRSVSAGRSSLRFRGSGLGANPENNWLEIPPALSVNITNGFSVFMVTRSAYQASGCFIKLGTNDGFTLNAQYRADTPLQFQPYVVVDGVVISAKPFLPASVSLHGFTVQTNGSGAGRMIATSYIDGEMVASGAAGIMTTNGYFNGGHIGRNGASGTTYNLTADIFELWIYDHVLNEYEMSQLTSWTTANYPIATRNRGVIGCFGDSIVGGGGSGQNSNYVDITFPSQLAEQMSGYRVYNFGYGGALIGGINANSSNTISSVMAPYAERWIVMQGGVNDLINGTNGITTYTNFLGLAKTMKSTGAKIAVLTDPSTSGGVEATNFNGQIRSNMMTDANVELIVDLVADWRLGTAAGRATNMQSDGVHPTQLGDGVMAEIVADAIRRSTNTGTQIIGKLTVGETNAFYANSAGVISNGFGAVTFNGGTLDVQQSVNANSYVNVRSGLNTKESAILLWDRTFTDWKIANRNTLDTPNNRLAFLYGASQQAYLDTSGMFTLNGGVALGLNGAAMTNILSTTTNIDFPSTAAGTVFDAAVSLVGAVDGAVVSLGVPSGSIGPLAGGSYSAFASNSVVYIRFANNALVTAMDPAAGVFRVQVNKFQ